MHHPYQCLATCRPSEDGSAFLIAASGHKLLSISLEDGTVSSRWPKEDPDDSKPEENREAKSEGPPSKKRRLSTTKPPDPQPNIISLTITHSHNYLVAVTAEDKCIRVFSISADGLFEQLSARCMPKRPCAIAFTADESQILAADKFGDVYSLPLLLNPEVETAFVEAQKKAAEEAKKYEPAATELTVHSRANRRALETQLAQAKERLAKSDKKKETATFSHKLLLGHVSMLTDMLVTTLRPSEDVEKPRTYVLTADRDEHIRISRGPPQTHVIEGYCLGHHEFVNKMCLAEPDLLVSGGGDTDLYVWKWLEQKLVNKIDLVDVVKRARLHIGRKGWVSVTETEAEMTDAEAEVVREEKDAKLAVSGIWLFEDTSMTTEAQLVVTVEGVPAVLHVPVASLRSEKANDEMSFLPLNGNVLDIGLIGDAMIVSLDNIHQSGSITDIDPRDRFKPRLQAYQAVGEEVGGGAVFKPYKQVNDVLTELNDEHTTEWHEKALQNLLYGVENLRKRGGQDESTAE